MNTDAENRSRRILKAFVPPIVLSAYQAVRRRRHQRRNFSGDGQDLDLYWDEEFAKVLETWGEGNVWDELPLLFSALEGSVIDIACGTGRTIRILSANPRLDVHGCDISDLLIDKAQKRGIPSDRLTVCDATMLPYGDHFFKYGYSIGSLEHFTEEGIGKFLSECRRTISDVSFHQHPTSRSGKDEGWITTTQSYHNNSVDWWLKFYTAAYNDVQVYNSSWHDEISVGKWFVCK